MDKKLYIKSHCKIKNGKVILDGKIVFEDDSNELKSFFKNLYKNLEVDYPKFFKMDNLSKLAFLAAELIFKNRIPESENTGIIFSNNASSLDTDRKHQSSINDLENYYPSPAVFVYTLPNIGIGEISIKHQLKSENAFFIFEKYNADFHQNYENILIQNKKCESVLAGWVNIDDNNYDAFLYLVSENGKVQHTSKILNQLYIN